MNREEYERLMHENKALLELVGKEITIDAKQIQISSKQVKKSVDSLANSLHKKSDYDAQVEKIKNKVGLFEKLKKTIAENKKVVIVGKESGFGR